MGHRLLLQQLRFRYFCAYKNYGTLKKGGLNDQQCYYRDMRVDGVIGPITLSTLRDFNRARGDEGLRVLAATINACRDLARQRQSQEAFAYDWFRRVVELGAE